MLNFCRRTSDVKTGKSRKAGLASILFALATTAATAQAPAALPEFVTMTMPVFSQIVLFPAPSAYQPAFSKNNENKFYIFEMVPKGETLEKWSGMITITGQNGASAALPTLRDYIGNFYNLYQNACPNTFSAKPIGDANINGHVAILVYFSCGQLRKAEYGPNGHSESVAIAFIQGKKDLYTLQWAERGAPQEKPIPFEAARWQKKLDKLRAARVCDRVPGEAAPYPSCIAAR